MWDIAFWIFLFLWAIVFMGTGIVIGFIVGARS